VIGHAFQFHRHVGGRHDDAQIVRGGLLCGDDRQAFVSTR